MKFDFQIKIAGLLDNWYLCFQSRTAMSTKIPRDALVIQAILKDMGITEYEPRVINQLLEFIYRKSCSKIGSYDF